MTSAKPTDDLIVLVADKNMEAAVKGLVSTPGTRLGIRPIEVAGPYVHSKRDPGVYRSAHEFLRPFLRSAARALVIFDRDGCGNSQARQDLEADVETRLAQNGWLDRSAVIVIDPELEAWIWSDSPAAATALGWRHDELREWLVVQRHCPRQGVKPHDPKKAVEEALSVKGIPRSSAIYETIARTVNSENCTDLAFTKFRRTLTTWFPRDRV